MHDLLDNGADFIKVIATGAVLTAAPKPGHSEYTEAEIRAAVEEAAQARHASSPRMRTAPKASRTRCAPASRSIEHGSLIDDEGIALMKQHGTWLVADIYNGDYIDTVGRARRLVARRSCARTPRPPSAARRLPQGGQAPASTSPTAPTAGVYPHGDNARQFAYMVRYGMTPMQAIQSATISRRACSAGEGTGLDRAGKFADLVAVDCDPLQDIDMPAAGAA